MPLTTRTTRGLEPTYLRRSLLGGARLCRRLATPLAALKAVRSKTPAYPMARVHLFRSRRPAPRILLRVRWPRPSSSPHRRRSSSPKPSFSTPLPRETPVFPVALSALSPRLGATSDPSRAPLGSNIDGICGCCANGAVARSLNFLKYASQCL